MKPVCVLPGDDSLPVCVLPGDDGETCLCITR